MVESFNLRKTLEETRRELAHALYQHEAACRVIAKLLKDKENAEKETALAKETIEELKSELQKKTVDV